MKAKSSDLPGRPLSGIGIPFKGFSSLRILDFSKLLPGPYATEIFADMGCRVTRVELPYFRDLSRDMPPKIGDIGYIYWMVNQNKKRLALDFRKPAGLKKLQQMIRSSDILIEGFRPGLMDRVGLGYGAVKKINSKLIYCSISGYSTQGPWRRKAGHDLNFLAVSGLLGMGNSEGRPAFPAAQIADVAGSLSAAAGILAALVERQKTKRGRHLELSLTDIFHSWLPVPLAYMKATGEDPGGKQVWWNGSSPFYRLYETQDGRWMAVGAVETGFAVALLDALGLSELRDLAGDALGNAQKLSEAIGGVFKSAPQAQWEERLKDKDVCVTSVLSLKEAADFLSRSA